MHDVPLEKTLHSARGTEGELEDGAAAPRSRSKAASRAEVDDRLSALHEKLELLSSKLDAATGGPGGGSAGGRSEFREELKAVLQKVLVESGLLQRLVERLVDRRLEEKGPQGAGEEIGREAARVAKEFLKENLGRIFGKEIRSAVEEEVKKALSSEEVKVLIDDKFRAVSLYLKTEVIPKAVRQALRDASS